MTDQHTDSIQVDAETYLEHYAEQRYEWKAGVLVPMSPVSLDHDLIVEFLRFLLKTYFSFLKIGRVVGGPYVMHLADSFREPDLMVVLSDNVSALSKKGLLGPADICIEVVSSGNSNVDYGDKLLEYESAGVREYWIIDPIRRRATFNRLNDDTGFYDAAVTDAAGLYKTSLLPNFVLEVPMLWQSELPDAIGIFDMVKEMLSPE